MSFRAMLKRTNALSAVWRLNHKAFSSDDIRSFLSPSTKDCSKNEFLQSALFYWWRSPLMLLIMKIMSKSLSSLWTKESLYLPDISHPKETTTSISLLSPSNLAHLQSVWLQSVRNHFFIASLLVFFTMCFWYFYVFLPYYFIVHLYQHKRMMK